MPQQELLKHVVSVLNVIGIEYMVTGSFASSLHGEPRMTHDIDLVVSLPPDAVPKLLAAFPPPDFYLSEQAIHDALRDRRTFNLLRPADGDKVDFWMLTEVPFDQSRFSRKRLEDFLGVPVHFSTPEDTILAKLNWMNVHGGSEKQFGDALGVFEVQARQLDLAYLNDWAAQLGIVDLWQHLQAEAKPI